MVVQCRHTSNWVCGVCVWCVWYACVYVCVHVCVCACMYRLSCHCVHTSSYKPFDHVICLPDQDMLEPMEIASLLITAVIHDLDHPGRTNPFLCNSADEMAILYNDT